MIELLIKLMYANSPDISKNGKLYAAQDENLKWAVYQRSEMFSQSDSDGLLYEATLTEFEAKLICLLDNAGLAPDWDGIEHYLSILEAVK